MMMVMVFMAFGFWLLAISIFVGKIMVFVMMVMVVMVVVVMVVVVMVVVVMMTAGADILRGRGGSIEFQFFSHYFFSSVEPVPAPAGADAARCCRGS